MINPEYINTLLTKFASARATRLNLVKQAGMVPPDAYDRASTANRALASRGYDTASGSDIFRIDPSYNPSFHPSQFFGNTTVDALDQSWSNPDKWTQNLADFGASAGLGALGGGQINKFLSRANYRNAGIPLDIPIGALNNKQLGAYIQSRVGAGNGTTSFSVGANPVGIPQQLRALLSNPQIPFGATPAMGSEQLVKAFRAAINTPAPSSGQTPVTARPQTVIDAPEVKEVKQIQERQATYDRKRNQLTPFQAAVPGTPAVAAVTRQVPAKDWANAPASGPVPPVNPQGARVEVETINSGKNVLNKPKDIANRYAVSTNEPAMSRINRSGSAKALLYGAGAGFFGNAVKNLNLWGTPWATTKMPVSVDEAGNPTDSSVARMNADAANAGR